MKTTYHFQQFLALNKIDQELLPPPLAEMVSIFDRMRTRLDQGAGQDKEDLRALLNLLDNEIYDHLEHEFFDYLRHNDALEYQPEFGPESALQEKIDKLYSKELQHKLNLTQLRKIGIFVPALTSIFRIGKYRFERKTPFSTAFSISVSP